MLQIQYAEVFLHPEIEKFQALLHTVFEIEALLVILDTSTTIISDSHEICVEKPSPIPTSYFP